MFLLFLDYKTRVITKKTTQVVYIEFWVENKYNYFDLKSRVECSYRVLVTILANVQK